MLTKHVVGHLGMHKEKWNASEKDLEYLISKGLLEKVCEEEIAQGLDISQEWVNRFNQNLSQDPQRISEILAGIKKAEGDLEVVKSRGLLYKLNSLLFYDADGSKIRGKLWVLQRELAMVQERGFPSSLSPTEYVRHLAERYADLVTSYSHQRKLVSDIIAGKPPHEHPYGNPEINGEVRDLVNRLCRLSEFGLPELWYTANNHKRSFVEVSRGVYVRHTNLGSRLSYRFADEPIGETDYDKIEPHTNRIARDYQGDISIVFIASYRVGESLGHPTSEVIDTFLEMDSQIPGNGWLLAEMNAISPSGFSKPEKAAYLEEPLQNAHQLKASGKKFSAEYVPPVYSVELPEDHDGPRAALYFLEKPAEVIIKPK
jgi:hypothetical protein